MKICKTKLSGNDAVRIGNTIFPWQTYFADKRSKSKTVLYACIAGLFAILLIAGVFIFNSNRQTHVKMNEKNGVRYIPMKINGQELYFVFDTGASSICISTLEATVVENPKAE
ncbi:hypothetical protein AGMMS50239_30840 [Bacteroidia bacterium]|nr:hypothetical protein AGMMS50239_30840 [Bacteroidia bacterium]